MKPASLTRSWKVRQVRPQALSKVVADVPIGDQRQRGHRRPLQDKDAPRIVTDTLAVEEPLELRVGGRSIAVIMRTPGHDADLAAGFLLTEGIVHSPEDIYDIMQCRTNDVRAAEGNVVDVVLAKRVRVDFDRLTRHVFSGSSCGLCGKATIAAVQQQFSRVTRPLRVPAELLRQLPARLVSAQTAFKATGGLHATALFDATGKLLVAREDVGRHNAMDKVLGHALRAGWLPLGRHILLVSGRVSFEIMQKALAAGVSVVAGISAPTSLAAEFARANGQTLVGFLRADRLNVYAGKLALDK